MNIIHVMNSSTYHPRALSRVVEAALRTHPVVVLSGARQTGKTTLVRNLPSTGRRHFETLDDLDALELARRRPEELLARSDRVTIDEVQRAPEFLLAVKRDVDARRRPGRFLLTGSANVLLMKQVADSLAGRAVYLLLSPFTGGEKRGEGTTPDWTAVLRCATVRQAMSRLAALKPPPTDWRSEVLRGGMPRAVLARSRRERQAWFDGFVATYLERDLRDLSQVASLVDFRRLMGLACQRVGQVLNQSELARDAGLAQATAHRYLNLLETTFQIIRLPAYAVSRTKRLVKSPKLYWGDAGLAAHLAGIGPMKDLSSSALAGALLENLVLCGLLAWREISPAGPQIHYWRTTGGAEIDFIIESGRRLLPIEVKAAARVRVDDLRHLEAFQSEHAERAPLAVVLHDTEAPHILTRGIIGLPISVYL
jgi:predicted AAA+ superfamily ATPase